MARPSEYNYQLCEEICSVVANGFNIKTVLSSKDEYPTFQTWCNWKRQHTELFDLYTRSIQDKADSVEEELEHIYSEVKAGTIDAPTGRLLIDTLKWKASKYYPKMFGDKVDVDHTTNGKDLAPTVDLNKVSVEAMLEFVNAAKKEEG